MKLLCRLGLVIVDVQGSCIGVAWRYSALFNISVNFVRSFSGCPLNCEAHTLIAVFFEMKVRKPESKRKPVRLRHKIEKASASKQRKQRKLARKVRDKRSPSTMVE